MQMILEDGYGDRIESALFVITLVQRNIQAGKKNMVGKVG